MTASRHSVNTFPIMLRLEEQRVIVVGGGRVGQRRAASATRAGAFVRLVAPDAPPALAEHVELIAQPYDPTQLDGALLVFACTDDRALNARIAGDARHRGALVNVADQPDDCDFYMPATLEEGPIRIAVGTGGAAPGLAGMLRNRLADSLPDRLAEFVDAVAEVRNGLRDACSDDEARMAAMSSLCTPAGYELFCQQGVSGLRSAVRERLEDA